MISFHYVTFLDPDLHQKSPKWHWKTFFYSFTPEMGMFCRKEYERRNSEFDSISAFLDINTERSTIGSNQ